MPTRNIFIVVVTILVSVMCASSMTLKDRVCRYTLRKVAAESLDSVTDQELYEAALAGMTGIISDYPYTSYLPLEEQADYELELQGQTAGIGIYQLQKDFDSGEFAFIPLPGAPAAKAGIKFGDRIVAVDGSSITDLSLWKFVTLLRGEVDTKVTLKLRKAGSTGDGPDAFKTVTITRAVFRQDIVCGDCRDKDGNWSFQLKQYPEIGYIAVTQFTDDTIREFAAAIKQVSDRKIKKLILDFRGNPGGFLPGAVFICDQFVPAGKEILSTRNRDRAVKNCITASSCKKYAFELVVLVDEDSASASEIVSACLQDHHRARIVGTRSFGKGTVQQLFMLPCLMGELRLTNANWWRPSNRPLHRFHDYTEKDTWGVIPDDGCVVPLEGFPKLVSIVVHDLRRSLPPDEQEKGVALQLDTLNKLARRYLLAKTDEERKKVGIVLGIEHDPEEFDNADYLPEEPNKSDSTTAKKPGEADFKPAGKAPWYDPQLDKAIEILNKK